LTKELITTFEQVFLNTVGRTVDSDLGTAMKLKERGTSIPTLERSKSIID